MVTPEVDPHQLHAAFADTIYGERLASQVRFDRYKPDDMSNEAWVSLLGPDVNNLEHMVATLEIADDFIQQMGEAVPGELDLR